MERVHADAKSAAASLLEGWNIPAVLLKELEADGRLVPTPLMASVWTAGRGDYRADLLVHVRPRERCEMTDHPAYVGAGKAEGVRTSPPVPSLFMAVFVARHIRPEPNRRLSDWVRVNPLDAWPILKLRLETQVDW